MEPILREVYSQAYPVSAICVQRFDDSLNSAIRITYRISLRSSSLREPRYPLLRVVLVSYFLTLVKAVKIRTGFEKGVERKKKQLCRPPPDTTILNPRNRGRLVRDVHRGLKRGYVLMILPQVHLRKPCYDFYFL